MRKLLLTQNDRYKDYQLLPIRLPTYQHYWPKNPMLDLSFFVVPCLTVSDDLIFLELW